MDDAAISLSMALGCALKSVMEPDHFFAQGHLIGLLDGLVMMTMAHLVDGCRPERAENSRATRELIDEVTAATAKHES